MSINSIVSINSILYKNAIVLRDASFGLNGRIYNIFTFNLVIRGVFKILGFKNKKIYVYYDPYNITFVDYGTRNVYNDASEGILIQAVCDYYAKYKPDEEPFWK
jgi:hypothetical protein